MRLNETAGELITIMSVMAILPLRVTQKKSPQLFLMCFDLRLGICSEFLKTSIIIISKSGAEYITPNFNEYTEVDYRNHTFIYSLKICVNNVHLLKYFVNLIQ